MPQKYGCGSWAEVFEKSGMFDVKTFSATEAERQGFLRTDPGAKNEKGCG